MGPLVAPAGTVVVNDVVLAAVTTAVVPLNFTVFWVGVELKPVPVRVTVAPIGPDMGEKPVSVGAGITVKAVFVVAVWLLTVMLIGPFEAPVGTMAVTAFADAAVTVATTPLNLTTFSESVALKLVPESVTVVPTDPDGGVNPVIVGGGVGRVQPIVAHRKDWPFFTRVTYVPKPP